jgi:hypothetical protein
MPAHLKTMALHDVQLVLGRALVDETFRKELIANPAATLKELGYHADRKLAAFFGKLKSSSFSSAAAAVRKDYHEGAADGISRPRCV